MRPLIALVIFTLFPGLGCSTYTLTTISAADAQSDFAEGTIYRVKPAKTFLVRSWRTSAIGVGQPSLELYRWSFPDIGRGAVDEVPVGTPVLIERYVRFDQHGLYDCGFDGWRFAIASIPEGRLRGTRFLIDPVTALNRRDPDALLLEPRQ